MSTTVHPGRATADVDGEVALFLIGMRINRLRAVRHWLPTVLAMGPMLAELQRHPELGLLGVCTYRSGRTILTVQYWRSPEHLERFATGRDLPHLPAWKAFNRRSAGSGAVGVFHETYRVTAGSYEALYSDMPTFGLAAATRRVSADQLGRGFRRRLTRSASVDAETAGTSVARESASR